MKTEDNQGFIQGIPENLQELAQKMKDCTTTSCAIEATNLHNTEKIAKGFKENSEPIEVNLDEFKDTPIFDNDAELKSFYLEHKGGSLLRRAEVALRELAAHMHQEKFQAWILKNWVMPIDFRMVHKENVDRVGYETFGEEHRPFVGDSLVPKKDETEYYKKALQKETDKALEKEKVAVNYGPGWNTDATIASVFDIKTESYQDLEKPSFFQELKALISKHYGNIS